LPAGVQCGILEAYKVLFLETSLTMRLLIVVLLIGFPILEGTLLIKLAEHNLWFTIAWVIFGVVAGIAMIKNARFALMARLSEALASGQFSLAAFIDSFRTVIAGLLFIFPGIVSDLAALLVLMLPSRALAPVSPAGQQRRHGRNPQSSPRRNGEAPVIIDGEFKRQ
jgi:UPF0716 protein FxsA